MPGLVTRARTVLASMGPRARAVHTTRPLVGMQTMKYEPSSGMSSSAATVRSM